MIYLAILDEHPVACDAIKALLHDADDICVIGCSTNYRELISRLSDNEINVILLVLYLHPLLLSNQILLMEYHAYLILMEYLGAIYGLNSIYQTTVGSKEILGMKTTSSHSLTRD